MAQNQIKTHTLTMSRGKVWSILSRSDDVLHLYQTEIPIQETKMKIDVENKGRSVPPRVWVDLDLVGDVDELVSDLKQILGLRPTDEIYTSTMFSMKYLVWRFQGNLRTFNYEMEQVLLAHKPDLFVIIGCDFQFNDIKANLELHSIKGSILIPSIAESKSIWVTWNPVHLNVVATSMTHTNIQVIILRKNFDMCASSIVYGGNSFGPVRGAISRANCPIRIKKTANMKMNIRGCCEEFDYAGVGGIIVNDRNEWLRGFRMEIDPCCPIAAELQALKVGLSVLQQLKWPRVRIQTQSIELVELMTGDPPNPGVWGSTYFGPHPYRFLADECKELLGLLGCDIGVIDEEQNKAALRMSYGAVDVVDILDEQPPQVRPLVVSDFTP